MSKIEWTERTWNPIVGCSIVSPGCTNCYAMKMAARLEAMAVKSCATSDAKLSDIPLSHYLYTTAKSKAGPVWTGKVALAPEHILTEPLRRKKATTYFVNSMGDLFHEDVPDSWIDQVFAVMALCPQHTFQVLTKRSARMWRYFNDDGEVARQYFVATAAARMVVDGDTTLDVVGSGPWPLPNVWLGVSAEDQRRADERIPDLLATPAAVRFVSAEPLLGPIVFTKIDYATWGEKYRKNPPSRHEYDPDMRFSCLTTLDHIGSGVSNPALDWIIVGGESGPGARPMHQDWARSIRDQCQAASVPFFFKQWGGWSPAPWKLKREPLECADNYKARSEIVGATHAMHPDGTTRPMSQPAWSMERSEGGAGPVAIGCRLDSKSRAGRLLDGIIHDAMPTPPAQRTEAA